jgi:predicted phosphoribosyltransferase
MAHCIASALQGEMDVIMSRKISHPLLPEYAIGAVDESGWTYYSPFADTVMRNPDDLDVEKLRQLDLIRQRRARYTPAREPISVRHRIVIVVDDGVATGATMMAALHEVRSRDPAKLVCAVPVASAEALHHIEPWVDELICLLTPPRLDAISLHYRHFPTVDDDEVIRCLRTPLPTPQEPAHERQATRLS